MFPSLYLPDKGTIQQVLNVLMGFRMASVAHLPQGHSTLPRMSSHEEKDCCVLHKLPTHGALPITGEPMVCQTFPLTTSLQSAWHSTHTTISHPLQREETFLSQMCRQLPDLIMMQQAQGLTQSPTPSPLLWAAPRLCRQLDPICFKRMVRLLLTPPIWEASVGPVLRRS